MIEAKHLYFSTKERLILKNVSESFSPGFHFVFGENKSGKTVLFDVLNDKARVTSGALSFKNYNQEFGSYKVYVEQDDLFLEEESCLENILIVKRKFGFQKEKIRKYLKTLCIPLDPNLKVKSLSKTEKKMLSLARAVLLRPQYLFVDQAFDLMNSLERNKILSYLFSYSSMGSTVLVSTSSKAVMSALWASKYVLHEGEMTYVGCI